MKISEVFYSIQGETSYAGYPCIFIRLAGCNLRCRYCDTTYAYEDGEEIPLEGLIERISHYRCQRVELTGGEPLLQADIYPLTQRLLDLGYQLLLETNGSLDITRLDPRICRIVDIKCPGSGMTEAMLWDNLRHLRQTDQVKFVLSDQEDYLWAREIIRRYSLDDLVGNILFSPAVPLLSPATLAEWILRDGLDIRLNLQLHKYIWPDRVRGH